MCKHRMWSRMWRYSRSFEVLRDLHVHPSLCEPDIYRSDRDNIFSFEKLRTTTDPDLLQASSQVRTVVADMLMDNGGGGFYRQRGFFHAYFDTAADSSRRGVELQVAARRCLSIRYTPLPRHLEMNNRMEVMAKVLSMRPADGDNIMPMLDFRPSDGRPAFERRVRVLSNQESSVITYDTTANFRLTSHRLSNVFASYLNPRRLRHSLSVFLRQGKQISPLVLQATCRAVAAVDWSFSAISTQDEGDDATLPLVTRAINTWASQYWGSVQGSITTATSYARNLTGVPTLPDMLRRRPQRLTALMLTLMAYSDMAQKRDFALSHQAFVPMASVSQYRLGPDVNAWDVTALLATKYFSSMGRIGGIPHMVTKLLFTYLQGASPYDGFPKVSGIAEPMHEHGSDEGFFVGVFARLLRQW